MIADIDLRIGDECRPDLRDLVQFLVIDTGHVMRAIASPFPPFGQNIRI